MATTVRVVVGVLRNGATQITEVATGWQEAVSAIRGARLTGDAYGLLGRDLVVAYNATLDMFVSRLGEGHRRISEAASALNRVATGYEQVDDSFYTRLGYIAQ
jgi:hypothetical protein